MENNLLNPSEEPKKRGLKKLWISLAVLSIAAVAGLSVYLLNSNISDDLTPPSLQLAEGGSLQGFVGSGTYLEFDAADYERTKDYPTPTNRSYGVQIFHADEDMSVQDILDSIAPQDKLRLLFLNYSKNTNPEVDFLYPDPKKDYDKDGQPTNIFYTYPAGLYVETKRIPDAKLDTYTIKAGEGFFLVVSNNFATWNLKGVSEAPSAENVDLDAADKGWHLYATDDFPALYNSCSNRVAKAYSSVGTGSEFEMINLNNSPDLKTGANMAWFYLTGAAGTCIAQNGGGNGVCTDGNLRSSDAEICVNDAWVPCDGSIEGTRTLDMFTCTGGEWVRDVDTEECTDGELQNSDQDLCVDGVWSSCTGYIDELLSPDGEYVCKVGADAWEKVNVDLTGPITEVNTIRADALDAIAEIEAYLDDIADILDTAETEMKDAGMIIVGPTAYTESVVSKLAALNADLSKFAKAQIITPLNKALINVNDLQIKKLDFVVSSESQAFAIRSLIRNHHIDTEIDVLPKAKLELANIDDALGALTAIVASDDAEAEVDKAELALAAILNYRDQAKAHYEDALRLLEELREVLASMQGASPDAVCTNGKTLSVSGRSYTCIGGEWVEDATKVVLTWVPPVYTATLFTGGVCNANNTFTTFDNDHSLCIPMVGEYEGQYTSVECTGDSYFYEKAYCNGETEKWITCSQDQDYLSQNSSWSCIDGEMSYCSMETLGTIVNYGGTNQECKNNQGTAMWMISDNTSANNALEKVGASCSTVGAMSKTGLEYCDTDNIWKTRPGCTMNTFGTIAGGKLYCDKDTYKWTKNNREYTKLGFIESAVRECWKPDWNNQKMDGACIDAIQIDFIANAQPLIKKYVNDSADRCQKASEGWYQAVCILLGNEEILRDKFVVDTVNNCFAEQYSDADLTRNPLFGNYIVKDAKYNALKSDYDRWDDDFELGTKESYLIEFPPGKTYLADRIDFTDFTSSTGDHNDQLYKIGKGTCLNQQCVQNMARGSGSRYSNSLISLYLDMVIFRNPNLHHVGITLDNGTPQACYDADTLWGYKGMDYGFNYGT